VEYEIPDVDPSVLEEYGCDRALGKWLQKQCEHYQNEQLPDDRAKKLENLGVQWRKSKGKQQRPSEEAVNAPIHLTKYEVRWLNTYAALEQFHQKYGQMSLHVPLGYELSDVGKY